jgi:acid phosphatase
LAHGPSTRLPSEFYNPKAREIADRIATEEWFAGYTESEEYRKLGIGALMGDIVDRMVNASVNDGWRPITAAAKSSGTPVKLALSGCHDTTLAALLTSLGAFDTKMWPPYTSSIAFELFKDTSPTSPRPGAILEEFANGNSTPSSSTTTSEQKPSLFSRLTSRSPTTSPTPSTRSSLSPFPPSKHQHYVRIRYNDQPVRIPGCAAKKTNHLPGDDTFCTLEAFKEIADKFTPRDWREACEANCEKTRIGEVVEPAGY